MPETTSHSDHSDHTLHYLALGGSLVTGAIILAPYALPALGIGSADDALMIFERVCGQSDTGSGIASTLNNHLTNIPVIGPSIANGGYEAAGITGSIGIGGYVLGKTLEKTQSGEEDINWGKIIRYGALATSALIALPALLTGINMGLTYLALAFSGAALASLTADSLNETIGTIGKTAAEKAGLSGGAALIPHLLTCGASFFPTIGAFFINEPHDAPITSTNFTEKEIQRRQSNYVDVQQNTSSEQTIKSQFILDKPSTYSSLLNAKLILQHADTGKPVTPEDLATTHTEKIHLMLINKSLSDYQHIHPQPTNQAGVYQFSFTPHSSENYDAWIDCTKSDNLNHVIIHSALLHTPTQNNAPPPIIINADTAQSNGLIFHWDALEPLEKGKSSLVRIHIADLHGQPVTDLEPIMGAYAHLVGFSTNGESYIHSHPMGKEPSSNQDLGSSPLTFHITPDTAGDSKFFLQIQRNGKQICVDFSQHIQGMQKNTTYSPLKH